MGLLKVMGPTKGDETITWDPEDKESTDKAAAQFKEKIDAGFKAYRVEKKKGEPITEFDPSLKEILLTPPMAGG